MKNRNNEKRRKSTETEREPDVTLFDLFLDELADILDAERQLTKALPKMAMTAQSPDLTAVFEEHLNETKYQISRLEKVFESLDEPVKGKKCKGMEGLLKEGGEMSKEFAKTPALDATLIAAAQKVEHYEIASYGALVAWAKEMGHEEAASLLNETLSEEKTADEKLTGIAETFANQHAEASR